MTGKVVAQSGIAKVPGGLRGIYPWETMNVGDSFVVETKTPSVNHSLAAGATKRYAPKKFSAGVDADGNKRVWRDE